MKLSRSECSRETEQVERGLSEAIVMVPSSAKTQQRNDMRTEIAFALERLLASMSYIEVGVSDICKEAHISKTTFYRYFQSKENIVRWVMKQAIRCGSGEIGRKYTWLEGLYITLLMQFRHQRIYCDRQSPELTNSFIEFSAEYLTATYIETITLYHHEELTEKISFQVEALVRMHGYMSRRWSEEDMATSPETMANYFASVVPYDLYKLLGSPVEGRNPAPKED